MSKYVVTIDKNLSELHHAGIKGMRWGVRRFQNPDGSLTEAGKKRYAHANGDTDTNKAVDQMVKNDLANTTKITTEGSKAAANISKSIKSQPVNVKRMDLSSMSNEEMQKQINREILESQYDKLFNAERQKVESGREKVTNFIDNLGTTLTVAGSALSIALAIKALKS